MKLKSVCGLRLTRCGRIQVCVPTSTPRLSLDYFSCATQRIDLLIHKVNFEPTPAAVELLRRENHLKRLRSQIVGTHIKYQPYAFTEHGILMLSSVLKSQRAVQVNIQIMRTFVRLRQMLVSNDELV